MKCVKDGGLKQAAGALRDALFAKRGAQPNRESAQPMLGLAWGPKP